MSYIRPNGDAINFSWVGKSAYTQPNGDAINFSWVDGGGGNGGGSTPEPIGQTIQFEAIVAGTITFTAMDNDEDDT